MLHHGRISLFAQLYIPISIFKKPLPRGLADPAKLNADAGSPLRLDGFSKKFHVDFIGQFVAFSHIAFDAGEYDVGPGAGAATAARDDMVESQFASIGLAAAILTGVFVAFKNVASRKADFFAESAVKCAEYDDFGDTKRES